MQGERKMLTRGEVGRGTSPDPSEGGEPYPAIREQMVFVLIGI